MEASELRIGNYVNYLNYDFYNDSIFPDGTYDEVQVNVSILESILRWNDDLTQGCYKPIVLTEEWLLKLGFEENLNHEHPSFDEYFKGNIFIGNFNDQCWLLDELEQSSIGSPEIKYVHQFQNLYFSLTGEELTIKEQ